MERILLVEDGEDDRDMLSRRLERKGYAVDPVENGEDALARIDATRYDLILMDLRLPGMSGYETTGRIRERRAGGVPIIATTAHALEEDREKAISAGCDDYHAKPVHFSKLLDQIEALLKRGPLEEGEA